MESKILVMLSMESRSKGRQLMSRYRQTMAEAYAQVQVNENDYLKSKLTDTQIANIKQSWMRKTARDVTPSVKDMIKKMDIPTQLAIKHANINQLSKLVEAEDHEVSMAIGQLKTIGDYAAKLQSILQSKGDDYNIEAWVQAKITSAEDYINSVGHYMENNPDVSEELKETFSNAQIAVLKKQYEPLRNKKISMDNANKLGQLFTKFDKDKNALEKLYGGDIPFVSTMAMTRLMTKHGYKADQLNKIRKEELEEELFAEGVGHISGFRDDKEKANMISLAKQHGLKVEGNGLKAEEFRLSLDEAKFTDQQIKMAYGVANDPRYKSGNYSGAVSAIEKIAKGLSSHPAVQNVLKRTNENLDEGKMSQIDQMQKDGKSAAEIAKLMKLDVKTVKSILGEEEKLHEFKKMTVTFKSMADMAKVSTDLAKHGFTIDAKGMVMKVDGKGADLNKYATDLKNFYKASIRAESYSIDESADEDFYNPITEACWTGYKQVGMKDKGGKQVPNCVPEETVKEDKDHEISMARGELEAIADKATKLSSMLQGKSDEGNPLEAWVQSKITKAKDYINSVTDYVEYNPDMANEAVDDKKKMKKTDVEPENDAVEKKEGSDDKEKLKAELEKKDAEIQSLKVKAETEKAKVAKKETEKMVNPETGEPLLQVGIAYKHLRDKMKKESADYLQPKLNPTQIQNIKNTWKNKKKSDVTPAVKQMIKNMDVPTQLAIKDAGINLLSDLVEVTKDGAYAIGMSQAKKKYNDEPSLDKKTITKGHEIAKSILKKEETIVEFTSQQIKQAYGIANDPRYKQGNYSGAIAAIEKLAKGLSKHPDVQKVLKRTNENAEHPAKKVFEQIEGLKNKAEKSGMPYSILKKVYDRGMAAWRGGHRPGASQQQWAFARVNSFITKSSGTWGGADKDLAAKVKGK